MEEFYRRYSARGGRAYDQIYRSFTDFWQPHLDANRRFIAAGLDRIKKRDVASVLGASTTRDIPLALLAREFATVHLVDIDQASLQQAVETLTRETDHSTAAKVRCHVADVTGGQLAELITTGLKRLKQAGSFEHAVCALTDLYQAYEVTIPPQSEEWKADYVISSGLASQLLPLTQKMFREVIHTEYSDRNASNDLVQKNQQAREDFRRKLVEQHAMTLATLANDHSLICWTDTVSECPFWGNIPKSLHVQMRYAIVEELDATGFPGLRTNWFQIELGRAKDLWPLLGLLSNAVATSLLSTGEAIALINRIIDRADTLTSDARAEVIVGGLSGQIQDWQTVAADYWRWFLKPTEIAALDVEARLLAKADSTTP